MNEKYIVLDNSKFTTLIVDPTVAYAEDRKWHCPGCQTLLFSINRKFAVIADGVNPFGSVNMEVPLNIFRMTKNCYKCKHYYIIYFEAGGGNTK
jgi:hypothetical protein